MFLRDRFPGTAQHAQRAIIDIGSNTVRLVIYGGPPRAPTVLHNEKVTARLGRGLAETGRISNKAATQALAALARYAALLRLRGVRAVDAVATAAVRDASNGAEFLAQVRALGLKPRLLSGEAEALASAAGVQAAFPDARGIVADLGGGSLELIHIAPEGCEHGASMPLGTLRLPALRAAGPTDFRAKVRSALAAAGWSADQAQPLYLVGGSWRALARLAMQRSNWPLHDSHGYEISPAIAAQLARALQTGKLSRGTAGIPAGRLAALPDAAALLAVLLEELAPTRLIFSSWGLREGILLGNLDRAARRQDPMLVGISAFSEAHGAPPALATMVAGWTAAANTLGEDRNESLRIGATMLALASMQTEPNRRVTQALDWALHKRWVGISAQGRAVLAATAIANTGQVELPAVLNDLAPPDVLKQAVGWGLAIRLCRKFSLCIPDVLAASALAVDEGQLDLTIQPQLRSLRTDAIEKDRRVLAQWLGLGLGLESA